MQTDDRIERYVLGQMDEQEQEAFEIAFIHDHKCIEQLELADRLHRGMQDLQHDPIFDQSRQTLHTVPLWKRNVPAWSLAAALLVATILPSWLVTQAPSGAGGQVDVTQIELAGLRSADTVPLTLWKREAQTVIAFYVDTQLPFFQNLMFDVEVLDKGNNAVLQAQNLAPNDTDVVYANLGKITLQAGSYQYRIVGVEGNNRQVMQYGELIIKSTKE